MRIRKRIYNEDGVRLKVRCPVCKSIAYPYKGCWQFCYTCGWMDDPLQREEPDEDYCANFPSLNQAREIWRQHHCNVNKYFLAYMDKPTTEQGQAQTVEPKRKE